MTSTDRSVADQGFCVSPLTKRVMQVIIIALEAHGPDLILDIHKLTNDVGLLSHSLGSVLDTKLSTIKCPTFCSYPSSPSTSNPPTYAVTRILVTLGDSALAVLMTTTSW